MAESFQAPKALLPADGHACKALIPLLLPEWQLLIAQLNILGIKVAFLGHRVSLNVPEKNHVARKASGACPVDLKVSKSQTTHALYLLSHGFFSGSRVSGNHAAHSNSDPSKTVYSDPF